MVTKGYGYLLCLIGALLAGYWTLSPGLSGGFLFDDHVNLPALGEFGGVHNLRTFFLYVTSGLGDPLGRPISLISFLLDANNWPASPEPFLRTNILLHLLNGALLYAVLVKLGENLLSEQAAYSAGLLGALLWLFHPLLLSTTLYVVQRESMLCASFVFLGLIVWCSGRKEYRAGHRTMGLILLFTGSLVCTALAMLCKANGVVLPTLIAVAEATLFRAESMSFGRSFAAARRFLIGLPVAAIVLGLLGMLPKFSAMATDNRPWTVTERLLSEPRVLFDYLALLIFPRPISSGVFHDNFSASTGLFTPPTTVLAFLGIAALLIVAWRVRRRRPIVAFAVLFFFAGHSLEASFVPLELYFEHRNYLPSAVFFWPLAIWLMSPGRLLVARTSLAAVIVIALMVETRVGAEIWGNPPELAYAWAARNAASPRAQAFAAQYEIASGKTDAAKQRLERAMRTNGDEIQLSLNLADAECASGSLSSATRDSVKRALAQPANAAQLDFAWLSSRIKSSDNCEGFGLQTLEDFVDAARRNPRFTNAPGRNQDFDHIEGLIKLERGKPDGAAADFSKAIREWPRASVALTQAALLGQAGRPDLGIEQLDLYCSQSVPADSFGILPQHLHAWYLNRIDYWPTEIDSLRASLQDEAGQEKKPKGPCKGQRAAVSP